MWPERSEELQAAVAPQPSTQPSTSVHRLHIRGAEVYLPMQLNNMAGRTRLLSRAAPRKSGRLTLTLASSFEQTDMGSSPTIQNIYTGTLKTELLY